MTCLWNEWDSNFAIKNPDSPEIASSRRVGGHHAFGVFRGIIFVAVLHLSFKRKLGAPRCSKFEEMLRISIWSFLWRKKDDLKDWHSFQVNQLYIEYLSFCFPVKKNEATHRFFGGGKKTPPTLRRFPRQTRVVRPQRQGIRIQAPGIQRHATRARNFGETRRAPPGMVLKPYKQWDKLPTSTG